jgi:hypothetical protein
MGLRTFVVNDDGSLKRWAVSKWERVVGGEQLIPEFANRRIRMATIFVATEGRKAVRIYRTEFSVWEFDGGGRAQINASTVAFLDLLHGKPPSGAVDARRQFFERRYRWKPSPQLHTALCKAALR